MVVGLKREIRSTDVAIFLIVNCVNEIVRSSCQLENATLCLNPRWVVHWSTCICHGCFEELEVERESVDDGF